MWVFKLKSFFSYFFLENEYECIWIWNYLKGKNIVLEKLVSFFGFVDIYYVIYFLFDIWVICLFILFDDIKNFRNSFNKVKVQCKYKKMQEDKVNVQFFFDVEIRVQFKELLRVRRFSIGEMLYDLIVEEYKRY